MYHVDVPKKVEKQIDRLPADVRARTLRALRGLEQDPRPSRVVKLSGYDSRYRIRVGDYRVMYDIFDDQLLILIIEVVHRRDAYR